MNILVIGGCGYIGSILVDKLLKEAIQSQCGHHVVWKLAKRTYENLTVIEGDIGDESCYPIENIDTVIHLANVANDPCGDLDAQLLWEINVLASMRLVEAAIANNVSQIFICKFWKCIWCKRRRSSNRRFKFYCLFQLQ